MVVPGGPRGRYLLALSAVLASGAMAMLWPVSDERQSSEDEAMNAAVLARVGGTVTDVKPWLSGWDGRSPDELIALAATHRIDSIVVAFEEAIGMKAYRQGAGAPSEAEADVLAIEGLEREVNNGGYLQFFTNSTVEFVPRIAGALARIGCPVTLTLTERALQVVLGDEVPTAEAVSARVERLDEKHEGLLDELDQAYFSSREDIATALFNYIQRRRSEFTFD